MFPNGSVVGRQAGPARPVIRLEAVAAPMVGPVAFGAPAVVTRIDATSIIHHMATRDGANDNDP